LNAIDEFKTTTTLYYIFMVNKLANIIYLYK